MIRRSPTQASGDAAEARALAFLCGRGLRLVARNVASRLGEIDLVMRDGDTLVFVEVRSRASRSFGGAAASVGPAKQRRLRREAQRYLVASYGDRWPACRFDVCALDGSTIDWIRDAF
ncbi:MAG: YraN family protein [Lautropia sp.]|nr:MAG: YraN family protein [Pseudomonadota bacterium]MBC6960287.1 YraN family protein [Lautropia sp.]MCL4701988.1 YraN family protein [Burkholderiaceae bacterium]MDL1906086.1 YraN family protein [Betaproteobacteria bacterium PRO1]MEB2335909.1 YraN family protein [Burkholderiales bacterium]